jgi:hypothetical protein
MFQAGARPWSSLLGRRGAGATPDSRPHRPARAEPHAADGPARSHRRRWPGDQVPSSGPIARVLGGAGPPARRRGGRSLWVAGDFASAPTGRQEQGNLTEVCVTNQMELARADLANRTTRRPGARRTSSSGPGQRRGAGGARPGSRGAAPDRGGRRGGAKRVWARGHKRGLRGPRSGDGTGPPATRDRRALGGAQGALSSAGGERPASGGRPARRRRMHGRRRFRGSRRAEARHGGRRALPPSGHAAAANTSSHGTCSGGRSDRRSRSGRRRPASPSPSVYPRRARHALSSAPRPSPLRLCPTFEIAQPPPAIVIAQPPPRSRRRGRATPAPPGPRPRSSV